MTPEIVERDEVIVVGVRAVVVPGTGASAKLWQEQFMPRKSELSGVDGRCYGVFGRLPRDCQNRYEYIAGVRTDSLENIPPGMAGWIIPAGYYATAKFTGVAETGTAARNVIVDWLPDSGYKLAPGPMFIHTADDPCDPAAGWDACVPVDTPEAIAQLETWFA